MTSEEECIAALRRAAAELGESPSKTQYEELGYTPSSATIQRVMGGWNEAKEAAELETCTSTGSRIAEKPDGVELPERMEWGELTVDQRWHYRNVEWNTERTLRRRRELRTWLDEYKRKQGGCRRCAMATPACIDFHHVDPPDKEMAINEMVLYGYSRSAIQTELDKCVLLCANCHHREHGRIPEFARQGIPEWASEDLPGGFPDFDVSLGAEEDAPSLTKADRLRAWTFEYKRELGCRRCDEDDPICLQFHHPDPAEKLDGVGKMISDGRPVEEVFAEVRKCVVLCANCHRKTHHRTGD